MKIIARRVLSASVEVDHEIVSSIGQGLLLYVGFARGDTQESCVYGAKKIAGLRIFQQNDQDISVKEIHNGSILSISQFTLSGEVKKGFRPSFMNAMPSQEAQPLYEYFNKLLADESRVDVKTGIFGADMKISSIDDGPFTILFDI